MDHEGVLIIGAGLAGLSCAYHLGGGRILEKETEVGGLCRSRRIGGFTFDFTGHLLHLRDPYVRELVATLAPGLFAEHARRARIYSLGRWTGYPFQANLYGLPPEVVEECLEGLERAGRRSSLARPANFRRWVLASFGEGIARHFMFPYNRKLWRVPPEELTAEWVEGLVPVPRLEEARKGAAEPRGVDMGYNVRFLYPRRGGMEILPRAFARQVPRIHLGREVVSIDTRRKKVLGRDGETYHYEVLVSTMPLPVLVRAIREAPAALTRAAEGLRYVSVFDLNLGIAREKVSDSHWAYFPEERFIFYRAGFPANFSADLVPPGASSIYVETAHLPSEEMTPEEVEERSLEGLRECGVLRGDDRVILRDMAHIPHAYVIFDRHRKRHLPAILEYLRGKGIISTGRYGGWEYLSMEEAVLAGQKAAATARELLE